MTDGVRRNYLGSDYPTLLDALQRALAPPSSESQLSGSLGRTGVFGRSQLSQGTGGIFGLAGSLVPPPPQRNTLADLLAPNLQPLPPSPPRNALADIFGSHPLPTMPVPSPSPAPVRRKVFFSFHFEDVCRTVQVRQSWRFRRGWSSPSDNFYDKSLWEKSRTQNEEYLKRIIRRAMDGSTVTCVLAGSETWDRPYVRFEIAHSLLIKNGLFTVFIHNVRHPQKGTSLPGHNPLSYMGLLLRGDGKGRVVEWVDGGWQYFELMKYPVPWPRWLPKPPVGLLYPLSQGAAAYDYVWDNGYENLPQWSQIAADAAGRR